MNRPDFLDVNPDLTADDLVARYIAISMENDGRSVVVSLSSMQKIQRALDERAVHE